MKVVYAFVLIIICTLLTTGFLGVQHTVDSNILQNTSAQNDVASEAFNLTLSPSDSMQVITSRNISNPDSASISLNDFYSPQSIIENQIVTSTSDQATVDYTNRPLKGVNLPVFASKWKGVDIKAELEKIKGDGFNAIRIFIYWQNLMPSKGVINGDYFMVDGRYGPSIDKWVNWCSELNISCILAPAFSSWEPPPAWAFPAIVEPGKNPGKVWDAMMSGQAPDEYQSLKDIWVYIAQRYKDNKSVIFDVFNEPRKGELSDVVLAAAYKSFIDEVVDGIRASESGHHKIIVEYYINVYAADNISKDVIRSIHWYDLWEQPYNSSTQSDQNIQEFKRRYDAVSTTGLPVMVGEFGRILYPTTQAGSQEWYTDAFNIFNKFGIKSWCVYCYSYSTDEPYSIINPNGTAREPYFSMLQSILSQFD